MKAPHRVYAFAHHVEDHTSRDYVVVRRVTSHRTAVPKLGVHVYSLGEPESPTGLAEGLLSSGAVRDGFDRNARCDIYTGFATIEACIDHRRREKTFRQNETEIMRREAVAGLSREDAQEN